MGGTIQTTIIPAGLAIDPTPEVGNHENEHYLIVHAWREDDNWGRGFSLSKNVGHASLSISVPGEPDLYMSLWPQDSASLKATKGKIIPTTASLSTYALDCLVMAPNVEETRGPDFSQKILLSSENHARLLAQANQMRMQAAEIYSDAPDTNEGYTTISGNNTLQYCFVNTNLSPYGRAKGIVAYNCTGLVQTLLHTANVPIKNTLIQFPTSLAREVAPHAIENGVVSATETLHATPMTNLPVVPEDSEDSDSHTSFTAR